MPLAPEERRYFVLRFRGKYLVYLVTPQGAALSPLTWGRLAALVARLTQGLYSPEELLLSVFVDDPCLVISGGDAARDLILGCVAL
eukprot:3816916-Lingulodinium_polyedra.AAC.1